MNPETPEQTTDTVGTKHIEVRYAEVMLGGELVVICNKDGFDLLRERSALLDLVSNHIDRVMQNDLPDPELPLGLEDYSDNPWESCV